MILYLNVFVKDDEHMGSSKWKRKSLQKKNGRENLNRDLTWHKIQLMLKKSNNVSYANR